MPPVPLLAQIAQTVQTPPASRAPVPFEPQLAPDVAAFMWVFHHAPLLYVLGAVLAGAGAWRFGGRRRFPPPVRRKAALAVALAWPIVVPVLAGFAIWAPFLRRARR